MSYNDIGLEYYDPVAHPTCHNFREAGIRLISHFLSETPGEFGKILEIGCGMSIIEEIKPIKISKKSHVVLSDLNINMISHSMNLKSMNIDIVLCDAGKLPFKNRYFDLVISNLGDPYNGRNMWESVNSILHHGGMFMYTTPSIEWANSFRSGRKEISDKAYFQKKDGSDLYLPSNIMTDDEIVKLAEDSGFRMLSIEKFENIHLLKKPISPKLSHGTPFVTLYACVK
ncbi:methyltransferase domain-containing protein [Nitrospirillum pindoramense]|uniref:Methyltransferase family protein n=1 Tax=Nitrospirillum amazonense TaxID=28077 RepID=A0A560HIQ8_9PROT|nr:methyltransferase domain-containing protein [Nitrospirillum amazonense]TWB45469.1 methyltransferase family protein [Nitrospirillum amazonense]